MILNIELLFETLAKIIGEKEGLEIKFKIERKDDVGDGLSLCEAS
jgi:hypothetical protein